MDNKDWRQRLYVMVFQADTPAGRRFDTALLLIILCSLVVVVLDSINSIHRNYADLLAYIEWGFTFVFAIEYGLRLYCSPKPLRYAFSFYGLVDLLARGVETTVAGELLDVSEEHAQWRGAAERVLRGFAMSLLVPQQHYASVAEWVNSRRLMARRSDGREVGVRLVYERVPQRHVPLQRPQVDGLLLADTVEIADTPLRGYLFKELFARADHLCAGTLEEFRAAERAVTR